MPALDCTLASALKHQPKVSRWLVAKADAIQFTDRYQALGIPYPNPKTMCKGQCEGTGFVPIYHSSGDARIKESDNVRPVDELDPKYLEPWKQAEAESPSEDGWHFIKCPDCQGSGLARALKFNHQHDTKTGEFSSGDGDPKQAQWSGNFDLQKINPNGQRFMVHPSSDKVFIGDYRGNVDDYQRDHLGVGGKNRPVSHAEEFADAQNVLGLPGKYDDYIKGWAYGPDDNGEYPHGRINFYSKYFKDPADNYEAYSHAAEAFVKSGHVHPDTNVIQLEGAMGYGMVGKPTMGQAFPYLFKSKRKAAKDFFAWVLKFNPFHDPHSGEFATSGMGSLSRSADQEKFRSIKSQWAKTNDELLDYVDTPDAAEAKQHIEKLKHLVKEMYSLKIDRGGLEGIGQPGGARDVVVVGAGPGGLAASVMGGTDGLDTLFIEANDKVGGQAKFSSRIENYPGFPIGTTGEHLAKQMYEQAQRVGAEGKLGVRVIGMTHDPDTDLKTLTLSNGETITSRSVILAGGITFKKLEFPGSDSQSVIYGDGKALAEIGKGGTVIVVGGSNGAAQAALGVAKKANHVYLLSRSPIEKGMSQYQIDALKNHPKIQVIEGDTIDHLIIDQHTLLAQHLVTKNGKKLDCNALGIFAGGMPDTKWLPKDLNFQDGKIAVDKNMETSIPGVFAVGDIRHGSIGRVGASIGDGQIAEHGVFDYFERVKVKAGSKP